MTTLQFHESLVRSYYLTCHSRRWNRVWDKNEQTKRSANLLITNAKKRKDLLAISEDAVLTARRKLGNNNQEKWILQQQKNKNLLFLILVKIEWDPTVDLIVPNALKTEFQNQLVCCPNLHWSQSSMQIYIYPVLLVSFRLWSLSIYCNYSRVIIF